MPTDESLVIQTTAQFFGGITYDSTTRSYRNPTIGNLGVVKRGFPNQIDDADCFVGQPTGAATGSFMVVQCPSGEEKRVAVGGATSGLKEARFNIQLHCFIISTEPYDEDVQDFTYQLRDNIVNKIHTDRTLGTGGFESGTGIGFMVGEGGSPWIRWTSDQPGVDPLAPNWRKQYLMVEFDALMMIQA